MHFVEPLRGTACAGELARSFAAACSQPKPIFCAPAANTPSDSNWYGLQHTVPLPALCVGAVERLGMSLSDLQCDLPFTRNAACINLVADNNTARFLSSGSRQALHAGEWAIDERDFMRSMTS